MAAVHPAAALTTMWARGVRFRAVPHPRHGRAVVYGPSTVTIWLSIPAGHWTALARYAGDAVSIAGIPVRLIPDAPLIGVQLPRPEPVVVPLAAMRAGGRCVEIGVDEVGAPVVLDLGHPNTAHAFVGGITGSGKSEVLRAIVAGMALASAPSELEVVGVDPDGATFAGPLARLRHLRFRVAESDDEVSAVLGWCAGELDRRLSAGLPAAEHPTLLVVIDELYAVDDELVTPLVKSGAKVRIHVVGASQEMTAADVAARVSRQFGARICGRVAPGDWRTSRAIVGSSDAQSLAGEGDMLAKLGARPVVRFRAAWAALGDRQGRPDDPWWSGPEWQAITWPAVADVPRLAGGDAAAHRTRNARKDDEPLVAWAIAHASDDGEPASATAIQRAHGGSMDRARRVRDEARRRASLPAYPPTGDSSGARVLTFTTNTSRAVGR